ncbi:MAG: hybrid sensor histidine kinase/response regulator [Variovorax paradoxus]|jgi:signal transduction histidine kinase|nr:MAG: hybrid sensor histidine kinase/response regulator [Variovorax paradoxus]PZQ02579.1 MAG: hybrid sensor histidine kinase/response regulator [Variovorax paradoxus]
MNVEHNRRILLVDDMPAIHEDFRKILLMPAACGLDQMEAALFGSSAEQPAPSTLPGFMLDSAYQGQEAVAMVCASLEAKLPYAMAFVDMRMPPGWDGVETIERIWQKDPELQVVICTAYADHSWAEVLQRLAARDRLLVLKKPFDPIEVSQLASTLTAKWDTTRQAVSQLHRLEEAVLERTAEIIEANRLLQQEMAERKHLQSQLVQSEKLASIGQLAAGVAHEINNPIGFVLSNFGALERYVNSLFEMLAAYEAAEKGMGASDATAALEGLRDRLELQYLKEDMPVLMRESKEGIARVCRIVQDLKDFSHVDWPQEWVWADLHHGIDSTLNVAASEIRGRAQIDKAYGSLPEIECLPAQLNQVVLNLLTNALHAMESRCGKIIIRTGAADGWVWFEVEDEGTGIAPDIVDRIFDPFFTTKPIGQGTGLGLSLSYGIVQKHRGRIEVRSALGQGSIFRVVLPVRPSSVQTQAVSAGP